MRVLFWIGSTLTLLLCLSGWDSVLGIVQEVDGKTQLVRLLQAAFGLVVILVVWLGVLVWKWNSLSERGKTWSRNFLILIVLSLIGFYLGPQIDDGDPPSAPFSQTPLPVPPADAP